MHVPSLQPVSSSHYCVSGDVTIHPTATIAAGVLLQADPGSQVIVGAGVCLGMGTVLHAHEGVLEIEAEVTVGTGVLIVGSSKVGANACIGSASTIWNHSIERGTVVPPLSLLGTADRQAVEVEPPPPPVTAPTIVPPTIVPPISVPSIPAAPTPMPPKITAPPVPSPPVVQESSNGLVPTNGGLPQASLNGSATTGAAANQPTAEIQLSFTTPVYGQASLNRLLSTLLPHRHLFTPSDSGQDSNDSSP